MTQADEIPTFPLLPIYNQLQPQIQPLTSPVVYEQTQKIEKLPEEEWREDFFGCFEDFESCALAFFCPCVQFGRNARQIDGADESLMALLWIALEYFTCGGFVLGGIYRSKLRQKHSIQGNGCSDLLTHFFCRSCALAQEAREIKTRSNVGPDMFRPNKIMVIPGPAHTISSYPSSGWAVPAYPSQTGTPQTMEYETGNFIPLQTFQQGQFQNSGTFQASPFPNHTHFSQVSSSSDPFSVTEDMTKEMPH